MGGGGLEEDPLIAQPFDRVPCARRLEPEATVDLPLEVLAGKQVVLRVLFSYPRVSPRPVEAVQREREPAHPAFDQDELEPGEPVADSSADKLRERAGVAHPYGGLDK